MILLVVHLALLAKCLLAGELPPANPGQAGARDTMAFG